jgi:hypothetical protein
MEMTEPTTDELRQAYHCTRLWMEGVSFERAVNVRLFRVCLRGIAINHRRQAARNGTPAPTQPDFLTEAA